MPPRSANEVMHDVIYAAVVDAIVAMKASAGGLPNNLVRNVGAVHANVTFADLPKEVQDAIGASTRAAFTKLLREGYTVANPSVAPARPAAPRDDRPRGGGRPDATRRPGPRPGGPGPERGPRGPGTGRPPRNPGGGGAGGAGGGGRSGPKPG